MPSRSACCATVRPISRRSPRSHAKAWTSLQVAERLVPAADHLLASQTVFDTRGFSQEGLLDRVTDELILAGPNLRNWLTERAIRDRLVQLVRGGRKVTLTVTGAGGVRLMIQDDAKTLDEMLAEADATDERSRGWWETADRLTARRNKLLRR
jgi:hypothetical protein